MTTSNAYEIESGVRLSVVFTLNDVDKTPVDPTITTLYYLPPGASEQVVVTFPGDLFHDGTGEFHYDLTGDIKDTWYYKWQGAGNVDITTPDQSFFVNGSIFTVSSP